MLKRVHLSALSEDVTLNLVEDSWHNWHIIMSVYNHISLSPRLFMSYEDALGRLREIVEDLRNNGRIRMVEYCNVTGHIRDAITDEELFDAGITVQVTDKDQVATGGAVTHNSLYTALMDLSVEGYVIW